MPKFVLLFFLISAPVFAQTPAAPPAMTPPAMAAPVPAPAVPPAVVLAAMTPPAAMVAPMAAPAPVTPAEPVASEDPSVPNLETTVKVPATADATAPATMSATPVGGNAPAAPAKAPTNWPAIITAIGMAIVALLSLLGGLGLMKWTKNARVQLVLKATKKGTEAFLAYAEKSPAVWDDAIAKILDNVNAVLLASGEDSMTDAEKAMATKLAVSFKNVAGK